VNAEKVLAKVERGCELIERLKVPTQRSLNDLGLGCLFHLRQVAEPIFKILW
jgi:hypothetical protein